MENLTVKELVISTKGKLVLGDENNFVNDIIIDSRKANENNVFVAIVGENLDGHNFIQSAYDQGCRTLIKLILI